MSPFVESFLWIRFAITVFDSLFGCPFLGGQPNSLNVSQSFSSVFDLRVPGALWKGWVPKPERTLSGV